VGDALGVEAEVDVDLRLGLLEQDLRRVRLLQRQVLQVQTLDLEDGGVVRLGHSAESGVRGRLDSRPRNARGAGKGGDYRSPRGPPAGPRRRQAAPSSGISPPRASSAIRSSQPPTCVSPMKICGTVRRPVISIIFMRSPGCMSTRTSSMLSTPLALRI